MLIVSLNFFIMAIIAYSIGVEIISGNTIEVGKLILLIVLLSFSSIFFGAMMRTMKNKN